MDPTTNPFAPGAGCPPPELAGRDEQLAAAALVFARVRSGHPAKSILLIGLRGVGKTVLLNRMGEDAESTGIQTLHIEVHEARSLRASLVPELGVALLRLARIERAGDLATRALHGLTGFADGSGIRLQNSDVGLDPEPGARSADDGNLGPDLAALLEAAGEAARAADTVLALFVDELQDIAEDELAAHTIALHRVAQRRLPVVLVAAGLPQLRGRMGRANSERVFDFVEVGPLSGAAAGLAIEKPIRDEGAAITPDAVASIIATTEGYPYFLQEWGRHAWDAAGSSPITADDVAAASATAVADLDAGLFGVRLDRLTRAETRYLRAMAELGAGPHRSGDIAEALGRKVTSLAQTRSALITKGMVWSPSHGDTAFTAPLFDQFMRRTMPGAEWRTA